MALGELFFVCVSLSLCVRVLSHDLLAGLAGTCALCIPQEAEYDHVGLQALFRKMVSLGDWVPCMPASWTVERPSVAGYQAARDGGRETGWPWFDDQTRAWVLTMPPVATYWADIQLQQTMVQCHRLPQEPASDWPSPSSAG